MSWSGHVRLRARPPASPTNHGNRRQKISRTRRALAKISTAVHDMLAQPPRACARQLRRPASRPRAARDAKLEIYCPRPLSARTQCVRGRVKYGFDTGRHRGEPGRVTKVEQRDARLVSDAVIGTGVERPQLAPSKRARHLRVRVRQPWSSSMLEISDLHVRHSWGSISK